MHDLSIRLSAMLLILALIACGEKPDDTAPPEGDADTDVDADSDADTDILDTGWPDTTEAADARIDPGPDVAGGGDLNGDGFADVVTRQPLAIEGVDGVFAYHGPIERLSSESDAFATIVAASEREGEWEGRISDFDIAPDMDGDGLNDVVVADESDPTGDTEGTSGAGSVWILPSPLDPWTLLSEAPFRLMGSRGAVLGGSVCGAGDVDGDGLGDILVGAAGEVEGAHDGAAYLVHGPVTSTASISDVGIRLEGPEGSYTGSDVDAADLNGDGLSDLIIAARMYDGAHGEQGAIWILFGPVSGDLVLADSAWRIEGTSMEGEAGLLADAGDVDDDGYDDILVGSCGDSSGGTASGGAYLIAGPATDISNLREARAHLVGEHASDAAGISVASAGDVDADGFDDLLIGAYYESTMAPAAGAAYLVRGPVSGTHSLSEADAKISGLQNSSMVGLEVGGAGDTDADGFDDLLVGGDVMVYLVLGR